MKQDDYCNCDPSFLVEYDEDQNAAEEGWDALLQDNPEEFMCKCACEFCIC